MDSIKIVYTGGEAEIIEKKSRFIATVKPVESEEEALEFVKTLTDDQLTQVHASRRETAAAAMQR